MNVDKQFYEVTATHLFNPARTVVRIIKSESAENAESLVMQSITDRDGEPAGNWRLKSEVATWLQR